MVGCARETCQDRPPCRGAGTLRSRSVGRMRQIRCIIPDLPRVSALRVGSPADASDAPLQGGPILARLPPVPPHWSAVRSRSSAFQARDRSPRRPKLLARGSSRAVGSWRAGGGPRAAALGAARLARQSGTRRGAPRSAAGPSRSSGPAACHRLAASGGSPRRRQGRRPRPPSGTAPQAGAASRPERIAAASVLSVRYTVMKEALDVIDLDFPHVKK